MRPELKVREYEVFRAYYCGVCRSMAERRMQLPRVALSNDTVFLAILLSSAYGLKTEFTRFRCVVHPGRKRGLVRRHEALDYAADVNILLSWYKALDDLHDRARLKGIGGALATRRACRAVERRWANDPRLADKPEEIRDRLRALQRLEKEQCDVPDAASEPFARLTACLFRWRPRENAVCREKDPANPDATGDMTRSLDWLGYNIGKWIYLADAWQDMAQDAAAGRYNPILRAAEKAAASGGQNGDVPERIMQARDVMRERIRFLMTSCLEQASSALALLPAGPGQGILENVLYLGLRKKMEDMLDGQPLRGAGNQGKRVRR